MISKAMAEAIRGKVERCALQMGFAPGERWAYWVRRHNIVPTGDGGYAKSEHPRAYTVLDFWNYIKAEAERRRWLAEADAIFTEEDESLAKIAVQEANVTEWVLEINLTDGSLYSDGNIRFDVCCNYIGEEEAQVQSVRLGRFLAKGKSLADGEKLSILAGRLVWLSTVIDNATPIENDNTGESPTIER